MDKIVESRPNCKNDPMKVNLGFCGCGFLGIYYVGVATCFEKCAPHVEIKSASGASFGAVVASMLIMGIPWGDFTSALLGVVYELRRHALGAFNPLVNIGNMLRNAMYKMVPKDGYKRCSGRLFISVTRVSDGANVILSEFASNDELIEALVATTYVPIFSGFIPPKIGNCRYVDGGFSDNLPIIDENTITVSPFCGESDICPRDSSLQLFHVNFCNTSVELSGTNMYRFTRILFPPSPEALSLMCKQGFEDALKFLQRNELISCTKCLAVQTTYFGPVVGHEHSLEVDTYDPQCRECISHRQKAAVSDVPETVILNFEHAIQRANKGLMNWVFRHKGVKIILMMGVPYMLAVDIVRAVLRKLTQISPNVVGNSVALSKQVVHFVTDYMNQAKKTTLYTNDVVTYEDFASAKIAYEHIKFDSEKKDKGKVIYPPSADVHYDTYEHILDVIDHHESLMAYYYINDQNKMKVMEFYDVSNDDKITTDTVLKGEEIIEIKENNENIIESWTMGNDDENLATSYLTPSQEQGVTEDKLKSTEASCSNSDPDSATAAEWSSGDNIMTLKNAAAENDQLKPKRQRSLKKFPGLVSD